MKQHPTYHAPRVQTDAERLVRIETKLSKLMNALGIDPSPGDNVGINPVWASLRNDNTTKGATHEH